MKKYEMRLAYEIPNYDKDSRYPNLLNFKLKKRDGQTQEICLQDGVLYMAHTILNNIYVSTESKWLKLVITKETQRYCYFTVTLKQKDISLKQAIILTGLDFEFGVNNVKEAYYKMLQAQRFTKLNGGNKNEILKEFLDKYFEYDQDYFDYKENLHNFKTFVAMLPNL